ENVVIKNWVAKEELNNLYKNCIGFLATARDEDFGLTPVEAMSFGKPVVAANEGGFKETIKNDVNGILIDDIDENKIVKAINDVENNLEKDKNYYLYNNLKQAEKFSVSSFIEKIKSLI
nr:glycosyltransferase [Patescibacteria group bacterium]